MGNFCHVCFYPDLPQKTWEKPWVFIILYLFGGVFDWYYCSGTTSIIELEGRTGSLEKELATKDSYIRELEDIIMEKVKKIIEIKLCESEKNCFKIVVENGINILATILALKSWFSSCHFLSVLIDLKFEEINQFSFVSAKSDPCKKSYEIGSDRFSRFDVYWMKINNTQSSQIYIL